MYKEIAANKQRTFWLILLFLILIAGLGWVVGESYQNPLILPIAVGVALVQAVVSYYYSDSIALSASGAVPLPKTGAGLAIHRAVENAAIGAGLPKPRVYFIDDSAANAFATGRDPQHAAVAVTRGLVEKLDKRELEGVLAHELSHIGNYDIRVMSMVVVLVGVVVLITEWVQHMLWWGGRERREGGNPLALVALVFALLSPLFATLIQLAISRKREFLADATGSMITRDPEGLARALEKIAGDRQPVQSATNATAHLYIANPFKADVGRAATRTWFANLFNTHPPIDDRVRLLRKMISS